jgi:hypothetical protein
MIAIISHHKIGILGHRDRAKIVSGLTIMWINIWIPVNGIGLIHRLPIYINLLVANLHTVPWLPNHPLYKVLTFILRKLENNNIAVFWFADWNQDFIGKRDLNSIDKLVDQNVIPYGERVHHRPGGNLEGLNDKGPDHQSKKDCNQQCLGIFSERGFFPGFGKDY